MENERGELVDLYVVLNPARNTHAISLAYIAKRKN